MTLPVIRDADLHDLDAITAIYADAVLNGTASYELEPPDRSEMQRRHEALVRAGYPYLAALKDGLVCGYAYAGAFRARPAYRFAVEDSVYVDTDLRGGGIGRLLLTELIARVTALGFPQVIAVIGDGPGNQASVALHRKLGFEHSGSIRGTGYKHGRWLDTVIMQREINGGAQGAPDPDSLPERFNQIRNRSRS